MLPNTSAFRSKRGRTACALALTPLLLLAWYGCGRNNGNDPAPAGADRTANTPFLITQAQLDAITLVPAGNLSGITGDPFNARRGDSLTVATVLRDITANRTLSDSVTAGSVYTLRSFYHTGGVRGDLKHVDVMVKREAGYNPAGGDFEFIRIMADSTTDYRLNPNGRLPDTTQTLLRGRDVLVAGGNSCRRCHAAAAGGDFLFHK